MTKKETSFDLSILGSKVKHKDIVELLGITKPTYTKRRQKQLFTQAEIQKIAKAYKLDSRKICQIFNLKGESNG